MSTGKTNGKQHLETLVLVKQEASRLRHTGIQAGAYVRSHAYLTDVENKVYIENEDYIVDYEASTIRRTAHSRIPDWSNHPMYGITGFNHNDYPDYSNRLYTIYIDYEYTSEDEAPSGAGVPTQANALQRIHRKLEDKQPVRYVVFGDSISTGGESSRESLAYYSRFASALSERYPDSKIEVVNKSLGGEASTTARNRVEQDVIALQPDLVSIGYGMNDQCKMGPDIRNNVPPGTYEKNIRDMVQRIQQQTDADIILVTPCLSNPLWVHSSGDLAIYSDILLRLARELGTCVANVNELWLQELQEGKSHESLLLNNVNHPNDYGHGIYFRAFRHLI